MKLDMTSSTFYTFRSSVIGCLLFPLFLFSSIIAFAQPSVDWSQTYGTSNTDFPQSIIPTNDGGYFMTGYNRPYSINASDSTRSDGWFLKLSSRGSVQWEGNLGGSELDFFHSAVQTSDGGYLCFGDTESRDGDISSDYNGSDFWLVKLDQNGNVQWNKTYGGNGAELGREVIETDDGGFIAVGYSSFSFNGEVERFIGKQDAWIIKVDAQGNLLWSKSYGGTEIDQAWSITKANDGGYVIAGTSESFDNDISTNRGELDAWIIKINESGNIVWKDTYGGSNRDEAHAIKATGEGYVVAGYSYSASGDVPENKGRSDFWIFTIDNQGALIWSKTYGDDVLNFGQDITVDDDGNIYAIGNTANTEFSFVEGDVSNYKGGKYDAWLIKLDPSLNLLWERTIGGNGIDRSFNVNVATDGSVIASVYTNSTSGDVFLNRGEYDALIMKFNRDNTNGIITCPRIENVEQEFNALLDVGDEIKLKAYGDDLPVDARIDWYYSSDPNFNPERGEGTSIMEGTIKRADEDCLKIEGIVVDACKGTPMPTSGNDGEGANELIIVSNTISYELDPFKFNLSLPLPPLLSEIGDDPIVIIDDFLIVLFDDGFYYKPDQNVIDQIQSTTSCNINFDFIEEESPEIPANSILVILGSGYSIVDYDFDALCAFGKSVYVAQTTMFGSGDFIPNSNAPQTDIVQVGIVGGCSSQLTYSYSKNNPNDESETAFIVPCDNEQNVFRENCQLNFSNISSNICQFDTYTIPNNFPSGTFYLKGILRPEIEGCNAAVTQAIEFTVEGNCETQVNGGVIALSDGSTEADITVGDGQADILTFSSINAFGANFRYVVTDDNNTILNIQAGNVFNFEGFGEGVCRVWGFSYTGNLTVQVGDNLAEVNLSDDCFEVSSNFVTINKLSSSLPATVVDIIVNSDIHNTLETAIIAAEIADDLSGEGPFTVFAPTDDAFAMLPEGVIEALLSDPTGELVGLILYHVLGAYVLSTDLSNGLTASTILGEDVIFTINQDGIFINDAEIIVADILADNGVVHVIDAVLLPNNVSNCQNKTATFTDFICKNNSIYTINGITYTEPGTYTQNLQTVDGCDSTLTVVLEQGFRPHAGIEGDSLLCTGTTTLLTGIGGSQYEWSNGASTKNVTVGTGTYTVTVTNDAGCVDTWTTTVRTDEEAPIFTACPSDINLQANTSDLVFATWNVPTATDNCGAFDLSSTHQPGSAFPIGTTTVVYTATDRAGNSRTCRFNVIVTQDATQSCRFQDSLVLVDFYNATGGANWINSWDLAQPMTNWHGVTLNSVGCVASLLLDSNNLTAELINFNLPNLLSFSCDFNELTGILPDFDLLPELVDFSCSGNELTGTIPDFSSLPNLQELWVSFNNFSGSIPNFSFLPQLRVISCSGNRLTGSIPDFDNIPFLRSFFCSDNLLTGTIPDFSNVNGLGNLWCYDNQLTGNIPNFTRITRLINFRCDNNMLTGNIPNFDNLQEMGWFDCNDNNLTGSIPDFNLPNLLFFDCYNNNLTGAIPDFSNLPSLRKFQAYNNNLEGLLPDLSDNCPDLEQLLLQDNNIMGCYPDGMTFLCEIGFASSIFQDGYNFTNNTGLPWQGDFQRFCNGEDQFGAPCDDGNPETENDIITEDCGCGATPIDACANISVSNPGVGLIQDFCEGTTLPTLRITVGEGETVDWYDAESGGNLILEGSRFFRPSEPGTYYAEIRNIEFGCVSTIRTSAELRELPSYDLQVTEVVCSPDEVGTQVLELVTQGGCDSVVTITRIFEDILETFLTENTCDPNRAGTETITLQNQYGCDSLVTTEYVLQEADETRINLTTCNPNEAGTTTQRLTNAGGCDSLVITTTTLVPSNEIFLEAIICYNESYQFGNRTLTETGDYTQNLQNVNGCDSIVNLSLEVIQVTQAGNGITVEGCEGVTPPNLSIPNLRSDETVDWYDAPNGGRLIVSNRIQFRPPSAGTYFAEIRNRSHGCVSEARTRVNLVIRPLQVNVEEIFVCEEAEVRRDTSLSFDDFGCDVLNITAYLSGISPVTELEIETCDPDEVGLDSMRFQNQYGCDSLVIINRILSDGTSNITDIIYAFTCHIEEVGIDTAYVVEGEQCVGIILTITDQYPVTLPIARTDVVCSPELAGRDTIFYTNQYGCDSLIITQNNYLPPAVTTTDAYDCSITVEKVDTFRYATQYGCDSLVVTRLFPAEDSPITKIEQTTCDRSAAGISTQTYTNQYGCDSLIEITTIYAGSDLSKTFITTCDEALRGLADTILYRNQYGCDSIVVEAYFVPPSQESILTEFTCDLEQDFDTVFYTNQYGCDSLIITQYMQDELPVVEQTEFFCGFKETETFRYTRPNACDSIVVVSYLDVSTPITYLNTTTCDPSLAGEQRVVLQNQYGCDSIIITDYALLATSAPTVFNISTCNSNEARSDTLRLPSQNECDSLVITNYVYEVSNTILNDKICQNYNFNGRLLSEAGTYYDTLQTAEGCDSILTLKLIRGEDIELNIEQQLCNGQTYEFGGETLSEPGNYTQSFLTEGGCDSIVNLILEELMIDSFGLVTDTITLVAQEGSVRFDPSENDTLFGAWEMYAPQNGSFGRIQNNDNQLIYELDPVFSDLTGVDSFEYEICATACPDFCARESIVVVISKTCKDSILNNIPTGFAPDATEAIDRIFDPIGNIEATCAEQPRNASLLVVDMQGNRVYQANPYRPWNGRSDKDTPLPSGIYYYTLQFELNGEEQAPIKKWVALYSQRL
ncbi:MAG: fasciclin domain-containing protein [Bacteroidota bacterium]